MWQSGGHSTEKMFVVVVVAGNVWPCLLLHLIVVNKCFSVAPLSLCGGWGGVHSHFHVQQC